MAVINEDLLMDLYWSDELTLSEIGQKLGGYGKSTVRRWMIKFGVPRRSIKEALTGKKLSKEHRQNISDSLRIRFNSPVLSEELLRELYWVEGLSCGQIERKLGLNPAIIRYWLTKYRIPLRSLSESMKGERNPFYGKKHSRETCKKIGEGRKGQPLPEETRKKMSASHKGKKLSEKTKKKLSEMRKGKNNPMYGKGYLTTGENHWNWRGGISFEPYSPEFNEALKREVRERDNYTCQNPDCLKYGNTVHHIDYDKLNCVSTNLITLCRSCNVKANYNREEWVECFRKVGVYN